jgi:hypothetical protein
MLQPGSPALGKGTNLGILFDLDGVSARLLALPILVLINVPAKSNLNRSSLRLDS